MGAFQAKRCTIHLHMFVNGDEYTLLVHYLVKGNFEKGTKMTLLKSFAFFKLDVAAQTSVNLHAGWTMSRGGALALWC